MIDRVTSCPTRYRYVIYNFPTILYISCSDVGCIVVPCCVLYVYYVSVIILIRPERRLTDVVYGVLCELHRSAQLSQSQDGDHSVVSQKVSEVCLAKVNQTSHIVFDRSSQQPFIHCVVYSSDCSISMYMK